MRRAPARGETVRDGRLANVTGALLVGGASRRMGRDKAHLPVGSVPAATRAACLLDALFEEVLLVGGTPPDDAPGRRIADPPGPRCALRGLVAALEAARAPRVLVLATDLPLMRADLLLALTAWPEADVVLPGPGGRLQPLCAIYRRDRVLPRARARLKTGELALRGLLRELECEVLQDDDLAPLDPRGELLTNVNTPEEWEAVQLRLREPSVPSGNGDPPVE